MRYFPGAARSRLAAASLAGVVTLGLLTSPFALADGGHHRGQGGSGSADRGLEHRKGDVADRIDDASADLDDASHEIVQATAAVQKARVRLQDARSRLDAAADRLDEARAQATTLRGDLQTSRAELADADADLASGQVAVEDQRDVVRRGVVDALTGGDPSLQAFTALASADSVEDLTRTMQVRQIIGVRSDRVYDDLTAAEVDLTTQQAQVEIATHHVADRSRAAADQLETVRRLLAEATSAKREVAALVTSSVAAKQHAFDVRRHDRRVLAHLRAREAKIRQKILALAAAEARRAARRERAGQAATGVSDAGTGFLTYPAVGYPVTSPYGYRIHPIYGYYALHDGDDFGVPCGTQLHAAAAGTVISSSYDSVWGNRMFLSLGRVNGHNMTVVYNHLSRALSSVGEQVTRGQVIGLSGTTGWSTGCHLHFTVLVDGVAVDPMRYL